MASNDVYPILTSGQPVSTVPDYTERMHKALALPDPVRAYSTNAQTLGTSTAMGPLPTPMLTPSLNISEQPFIGSTGCKLQCLLTFGSWSITHAGAGDIRLGARVVNSYGTELANSGAVGVDWTRTFAASGSVERTRTVTFSVDQYSGTSAELLYAISGSPTTKTIAYGFVELTPLRWVAP